MFDARATPADGVAIARGAEPATGVGLLVELELEGSPRAIRYPTAPAAEHRSGLEERPHRARPRAELADPATQELLLDQLERALSELGGDRRVRVRSENRPEVLETAHLAPAGLAARQMRGELPARGLVRFAGQPVEGDRRYVAAVHDSPSEKWAFSVSTARKMRVLTAPTEIPSVSAISAYGIPW